MSDRARKCILVIILFIFAFSLRIYKVGSAPSGVLVDEASFGYNAYSILKTGHDEHGIKFPMIFKAFGDQKLPAYAYSIVPFIKVFGPGNLAVRFPSILAGSLLSVVMFLFLLKFGFGTKTSFIGGMFVATSPWSIILSRFGYESNLALLFLALGILFSLHSEKRIYAIFGGLFLGLTFYSYIAYRLLTPLILLSLLIIYYRKKLFINKFGLILLAAFIITIIPLLPTIFTNQGMARFNQIGIFSNSGTVLEINENRTFCTEDLPKLLCYINANKPLSYSKTILFRYIRTFSPEYLFLTGEQGLTFLQVGNQGEFSIFLLPFYLIGLIYIIKRIVERKLTKNELFLASCLIIAPLSAALAGDPQKVRLSALFPFLVILMVYGISAVKQYVKKSLRAYVFIFGVIFLFIISLFFMVNFLTIHIKKNEIAFGTYVPKLMKYLGKQDKTTQIYIKSFEEAIMFYAYVNNVDPIVYQKSAILKDIDRAGFAHAEDLENIHTTDKTIDFIYCESKQRGEKALYVTNENLLSPPYIKKKIIMSENGVDKLMYIYDFENIKSDSIDCNK